MSIDSQSTTYPPSAPPSNPLISGRIIMWVSIGAAVLAIVVIGLMFWLALNFPAQIEAVRDIVIMLFALTACSTVVVLIMLLVAVTRLINMLEFEIKPILEKTNETITTVQGTTAFVSAKVVRPAITVAGYMAGIRQGIRTIFGDPKRNLPD